MMIHHYDSPGVPDRVPFKAAMALEGFLSGLAWPWLPWAPSINATHQLMAPMVFSMAPMTLFKAKAFKVGVVDVKV